MVTIFIFDGVTLKISHWEQNISVEKQNLYFETTMNPFWEQNIPFEEQNLSLETTIGSLSKSLQLVLLRLP